MPRQEGFTAQPLGVPWEQTFWFREASRTYSLDGEPTEYTVPRPTGNSLNDVTSFLPGQKEWSIDNLPDILYVLRPPAQWHTFKKSAKPAQKVDGYNNPMFERYPEPGKAPRPMLDYKILPDKIGTREAWWFLVAIRRIDPRIGWQDILMRMELVNREPLSSIQWHIGQTWLPLFAMLSWHGKGESVRELEVLSKLTAAQVAVNTTRGTTPGLSYPLVGEAGGRIPLPIMGNATPRRTGISGNDVTEYHPGQQSWSLQNLPDVLYMLKPPQEWYTFKYSAKPGQKVDARGNPMFEQYAVPGTTPRPLLDYPVLPNKIGTNEEWFVLQAIKRLDPRLTWADITMRMELAGRSKANTIQERACRTWNPLFSIINWHAKGRFVSGRNAKDIVVYNRLTPMQIQNNTTRGTTPGLVDPSLGVAGGIAPLPQMRPGKGEARPRRNVATQLAVSTAQQGATATQSPLATLGSISAHPFPASLPSSMYSYATAQPQTPVPSYVVPPTQTTQLPDFDSLIAPKLANTRQLGRTHSPEHSHRIGPVRTSDSLHPRSLDSKRDRFRNMRSGRSLICAGYQSGPRAISSRSEFMLQEYSHAQTKDWNNAYEDYPMNGPALSLPGTQHNQRHRQINGENFSPYGGITDNVNAYGYASPTRQENSAGRLTDGFPQYHPRRLQPIQSKCTSETVDDVSGRIRPSLDDIISSQYNPSTHCTSFERVYSFDQGSTSSPIPTSCASPSQANVQIVRPRAAYQYHLEEGDDEPLYETGRRIVPHLGPDANGIQIDMETLGQKHNDQPYRNIYRHEDEMEGMTAANPYLDNPAPPTRTSKILK